MNNSVKLVKLFEGMFMPCAAEIAQYIYDTSSDARSITTVRRQVNRELEEGVQANVLTRTLGRQPDNAKSVTRFTTRKHAEASSIKCRLIETRVGVQLNGNTKRIRQCLGAMIASGMYKDKVFTGLDASIEPLYQYIQVLSIKPADELRKCAQYNKHWSINIRHVLQNHFGILNDTAFSLIELKEKL